MIKVTVLFVAQEPITSMEDMWICRRLTECSLASNILALHFPAIEVIAYIWA